MFNQTNLILFFQVEEIKEMEVDPPKQIKKDDAKNWKTTFTEKEIGRPDNSNHNHNIFNSNNICNNNYVDFRQEPQKEGCATTSSPGVFFSPTLFIYRIYSRISWKILVKIRPNFYLFDLYEGHKIIPQNWYFLSNLDNKWSIFSWIQIIFFLNFGRFLQDIFSIRLIRGYIL